jgi:predicted NBD/HSP70 family sugar kinase
MTYGEFAARKKLNGYAVDLGGTKTSVAHIQRGEIINQETFPTQGSLRLDAQLDLISSHLFSLGYSRKDNLGFAITGQIDRQGVWSAVNSETLPNINGAPLAETLKNRFGKVNCCNDAIAATLAEFYYGAAINVQDFVYLTVSTGVGGGVIVGNRLIESSRGLAGHFGFTSVNAKSYTAVANRQTTVEGSAGGKAIASAAAALGYDKNAKEVFMSAEAGENWANDIIETSAQAVADLCANIAVSLDPELIAIGGSIGLAPGYIERIETHLHRESAFFQCRLCSAQLTADGPLLGALAYTDAKYL